MMGDVSGHLGDGDDEGQNHEGELHIGDRPRP
jgi:hypothetical protein